jgi:hypothetical protein
VLHQVGQEALTGLPGREVAVRPRLRDLAPVLEVEPGAEGPPRAREDRHLAAVVGRYRVERVVQFRDEAEVDRVQPVRAVQADGRDVIGHGL